MPPQESLGEVIRQRRQEKQLRIKDLADRIGMSTGHISKIENNSVPAPSAYCLHQLETALGFAPGTLRRYAPEPQDGKRRITIQDRDLAAASDAGVAAVSVPAALVAPPSTLSQEDQRTLLSGRPLWGGGIKTLYGDVAMAYVSVGAAHCSAGEYREGIAAYEQAENICRQQNIALLLKQVCYRLARTCQALARSEQYQEQPAPFWLWRALAYLNLILTDYAGDLQAGAGQWTPDMKSQGTEVLTLLPASLAVSGGVSGVISAKLLSTPRAGESSLEREPGWSEENREPVSKLAQEEAGQMLALGLVRHRQADAFYARLEDLLERAEQEDECGENDRRMTEDQRAYVTFLRALNAREMQKLLPAHDKDFGPCFALFRQAISIRHRLARDTSKADTAEQRHQLARYHLELGLAYDAAAPQAAEPAKASGYAVTDAYVAALWHLRVALVLSGGMRDRYVRGDMNLVGAEERVRDDMVLHSPSLEQEVVRRVNQIAEGADFGSLAYDLDASPA